MYYILARHIRNDIVDCVASAKTIEEVILWIKRSKEDDELEWEYKIVRWDFGENN